MKTRNIVLAASLALLLVGMRHADARRALADGGLAGAIGCDSRAATVLFPRAPGTDTAALTFGEAGLRNAALDAGQPLLAATCQAVYEDPSAAEPFAVDAGTVTYSVSGPGLIVESGGQEYSVTCGDPAQARSCPGALAADSSGSTITGTSALTIHVALTGTPAPLALPAQAAIGVQAVFQPRAGGDPVVVNTAIDLVASRYRIEFTPTRSEIGSDVGDSAALDAKFWHAVPDQCSAAGPGPYLVCARLSLDPGAEGAEPGTVTFSTNLGVFVNGGQTLQVPCGTPSALQLGGLVAAAGAEGAYLQSCHDAGVRLSPFGSSGDAFITASFAGAVTGSTASASTQVTIAPQPPTVPLTPGCTGVAVPSGVPSNAPVSLLVESVTPPEAVAGVWRLNPDTGAWESGYLRDAVAPTDFTSVNAGDVVYVCVDTQARYPLG